MTSVGIVPGRREPCLVVRERLLERAFLHLERRQHGLLHELWKWFGRHVDDQLLHDGVAAAGVTPSASGPNIDPDRQRVGGLRAVQNLDDAWGAAHPCRNRGIREPSSLPYGSRGRAE